ncbi:MAG: hypothetical protein M3066_01750 [Actinomycetota bacterium]|nr:hypothetical protein [Actinomycetota bacterium]
MLTNRRRTAVAAAALVVLAGCSGGSSGGAPARRALGDDSIDTVDVVARADLFQHPLDAAPSPDGSTIYFTATAADGPGVFSASTPGGPVAEVATGAPLVRPSGIAVATDGSRIFTADSRAGSADTPGGILTAPTSGSVAAMTVLGGTEGRAPRGLDVVHRDSGDIVYFTGTDPASGAAGVFQVPAAGGAVTIVAEGPPFASLDSVVVSAQGVAYVSDRGPTPGQGVVYKVSGGSVTTVLSGLHLGAPAGVTLIDNDTVLLVSSANSGNLSDQVLFVDLATGRTAPATKGIGTNSDSSGGIHRAYSAPVLAWADTNGQIYRVRPR